MSLDDLFNSVICSSCGVCKNYVLCEKCILRTLSSNGLDHSVADEIKGLSFHRYGSADPFGCSDLYSKLKELRKRDYAR